MVQNVWVLEVGAGSTGSQVLHASPLGESGWVGGKHMESQV